MVGVRIGLMGTLVVTRDGRTVTPSRPKLRQLLALLAAEGLAADGASAVRHDMIARELWDAEPSARSSRIVQTYVSQLRSLLGGAQPARIVHVAQVGYLLDLGDAGWCDSQRIAGWWQAADRLLENGDHKGALGAIDRAHALCRGEALADVPLGPVLRRRRERLDGLRLAVLQRRGVLHGELGRTDPGRASMGVVLVPAPGGVPGPVRAVPAPAQIPIGLPTFVGFGDQLAAGRTALDRPGAAGGPVVAVVGGPGSGKSAFCTQLAGQVGARYPGGHVHADLGVQSPPEALADFIRAVAGAEVEVPEHVVERSRLFRRRTERTPVLVLLDNVTDLRDVAALQPGGPLGAMIVACRRRSWADVVTEVVELRATTDDELMAMLVTRVGRARVEREPEAARAVVGLAFGLPIAITAMAALLRSRPHWTLARLVARLMGRMGGRIELFLGSVDLAATVEITLGLLSAPARRSVLRIAQGICGDDPFSARRLALETGLRFSDAEQVLEEAVEIRVADPVVGAGGERCYRMNLIYRLAMVDWLRRGDQLLVSGS